MLDANGNTDFAFINKLKGALLQNDFAEVFIDTDAGSGINVGDNYETRIYQAIDDCDLFLAVIGKKWLEILVEKATADERDSVVFEIRAAIRHEKEFVPVLVDGAQMPALRDLVEDIRQLHFQNGVSIASDGPVDAIAAKLREPSREVERVQKLESGWTWTYVTLAVTAYYLCAIAPHIFGMAEFGSEAWLKLALAWSGFFIWPIFFLPFTLLAFYRPLSTLIECAANAVRWQDTLTYSTPLIAGTVLAGLAILMEVSPPQVAWTVHPNGPPPDCQREPPVTPNGVVASYDDKLRAVTSYDAMDNLKRHYGDPFWLRDKCWPNAFFYLTIPQYTHAADNTYLGERVDVARAFNFLLKDSRMPYSTLFPHYVISFAVLIWLTAIGILMSIFYVTVKIRRAHDGRVRSIPTEDAYLCLTYAFIALMVWVPFRINTIHFKELYRCEELYPCPADIGPYFKDIVLAIALLIAYIYLTVGLLVKYHRFVLAIIGSAAIALTLSGAIGIFWFPDAIATLAENWQVFIGIAILAILALFALWYQFDPAIIRFNDFHNDQIRSDAPLFKHRSVT